jgi:hypothetical protein
MADWGILSPGHYLLHDRDGKYCPTFQQMPNEESVKQSEATKTPVFPFRHRAAAAIRSS